MKNSIDEYDTSDYSPGHYLHDKKNKKVLALDRKCILLLKKPEKLLRRLKE